MVSSGDSTGYSGEVVFVCLFKDYIMFFHNTPVVNRPLLLKLNCKRTDVKLRPKGEKRSREVVYCLVIQTFFHSLSSFHLTLWTVLSILPFQRKSWQTYNNVSFCSKVQIGLLNAAPRSLPSIRHWFEEILVWFWSGLITQLDSACDL